jgi:hypothetical protein
MGMTMGRIYCGSISSTISIEPDSTAGKFQCDLAIRQRLQGHSSQPKRRRRHRLLPVVRMDFIEVMMKGRNQVQAVR